MKMLIDKEWLREKIESDPDDVEFGVGLVPFADSMTECPRCGESALIDFDHSVACLACAYILAMTNT